MKSCSIRRAVIGQLNGVWRLTNQTSEYLIETTDVNGNNSNSAKFKFELVSISISDEFHAGTSSEHFMAKRPLHVTLVSRCGVP